MAQLVEQLIRNQQVTGSSPVTSSIKREEVISLFFYLLQSMYNSESSSNISAVLRLKANRIYRKLNFTKNTSYKLYNIYLQKSSKILTILKNNYLKFKGQKYQNEKLILLPFKFHLFLWVINTYCLFYFGLYLFSPFIFA